MAAVDKRVNDKINYEIKITNVGDAAGVVGCRVALGQHQWIGTLHAWDEQGGTDLWAKVNGAVKIVIMPGKTVVAKAVYTVPYGLPVGTYDAIASLNNPDTGEAILDPDGNPIVTYCLDCIRLIEVAKPVTYTLEYRVW